MPTITNPLTSVVVMPVTRRFVRVRQSWSGRWRLVNYMWPIESTDALAPELGSATFMYNFGRIKREDRTTFAQYNPPNFIDWYIQILTQQRGLPVESIWNGVIVADESHIDRSLTLSGDQTIHASSLGYLLNRRKMYTAWCIRNEVPDVNGAVTGDYLLDEISWMPHFNDRAERGKGLKGNRSSKVIEEEAAKGKSIYVFSNAALIRDKNRDGYQWSNLDIIRYLLYFYGTPGITWEIGGQFKALDQIHDHYNFEGATVWEALNVLIDRRRGFCFEIKPHENGKVYVWIQTIADRPISYGASVLPANNFQIPFVVPEVYPVSHWVDTFAFRRMTTTRWDKIEIYGERIKVTGTFSQADSTLTNFWMAEEQRKYDVAKGPGFALVDQNKHFRSRDQFRDVYTALRVPYEWNWDVRDGTGNGDKYNLALRCRFNGTFSPDPKDKSAMYNAEKQFLRDTPFEVGTDYSVVPPTTDKTPAEEIEYVPLLVAVKDKDWTNATHPTFNKTHRATERYYLVDRLNEAAPQALTACHVHSMDKWLGIRLGVTPRHYFAGPQFGQTVVDPGKTDEVPELNWQEIVVTGTIVADERMRITLERQGVNPNTTQKVVVIHVPGAEYWYAAPGTIFDISDEGSLKRVNYLNRVLRNDVGELRATAAFASAWYGRTRQCITIPIKRIGRYVELGAMLNFFSMASGIEAIRTVISARTIQYKQGSESTTFETGWGAMDFAIEPPAAHDWKSLKNERRLTRPGANP